MVLLFVSILGLSLTVSAKEPDKEEKLKLCSEEDMQIIWDYFTELTHNSAGAAAIMGNLYYESQWIPTVLEKGVKLPEEMTEDQYTLAVDTGKYTDFAKDGIGYGLAQWTDRNRKAGLLTLAREQEKSIGDLELQLQYIGQELERFNMLYRLSHSNDIEFLSDYVLKNYENPGFQDDKVSKERAQKSLDLYFRFTAPKKSEEKRQNLIDGLTESQRKVQMVAMNSEAYGIPADSGYCQAWATAVYRKAGFPIPSASSAAIAARKYGVHEDMTQIPVGAAVYGKANTRYGHVGIYVGNNQVYHNIGSVAVDSLNNWIKSYKGYCWGWPGNVDLTECSKEESS